MQFSVQGLTFKNVCNVISFRGRQKQRNHVPGNDIKDALSPSTVILLFISD